MRMGNILRELREEKDLTQVELAKKLNITSQSLSQCELGKRLPDIEMINILADFFNVSIDYLVGRTNIKNYGMLSLKDSNSKYYVDNLSSESQKALEDYIELLKLKDMQIKKY
ncbi:helix-turn-helix domain-containing protein [Tissierella carlieri]|uniref:Helix-turn-helix domain-containing protein n=1 Tax=Tissierella carlieri TaxID=689904 RepID=A0ABT1SEY5_9FIRM|nr:helix-turn-helix transcriptional regulator [Tissierella carlieri]MCQ4925044.1 helix-turn-helix domain-containing protein [Tissierella carlieri]